MQTTVKAHKKCRNNEIGQSTEFEKYTVKLDEVLCHFQYMGMCRADGAKYKK